MVEHINRFGGLAGGKSMDPRPKIRYQLLLQMTTECADHPLDY